MSANFFTIKSTYPISTYGAKPRPTLGAFKGLINVLVKSFFILVVGSSLHGCASERVVEKPIVVHVPGPVKYVDIPPELLVKHQKTDIPESITWGEGAILWSLDRAIIDTLLGQLAAIESLNDGTISGDNH